VAAVRVIAAPQQVFKPRATDLHEQLKIASRDGIRMLPEVSCVRLVCVCARVHATATVHVCMCVCECMCVCVCARPSTLLFVFVCVLVCVCPLCGPFSCVSLVCSLRCVLRFRFLCFLVWFLVC
jgi:hypothetical protein